MEYSDGTFGILRQYATDRNGAAILQSSRWPESPACVECVGARWCKRLRGCRISALMSQAAIEGAADEQMCIGCKTACDEIRSSAR